MANTARIVEKTLRFLSNASVELRNFRQKVWVREVGLAVDIAFVLIATGISSSAYASMVSNRHRV